MPGLPAPHPPDGALIGASGRRYGVAGAPSVADAPWRVWALDDEAAPLALKVGPAASVHAELAVWRDLARRGMCDGALLDSGPAGDEAFVVHPWRARPPFVIGAGLYLFDDLPAREGGQGEVRRAIAPDGSLVAVKLAWPDRRGARLGHERRLLQQAHAEDPALADRVLRVRDHGVSPDGRVFVVLDPWMTDTLDTWLARTPDLASRLLVLERCADALDHYQRHPDPRRARVHRDIKPGNLLVRGGDDGPDVRLADLGGAGEGGLLDRASTVTAYTPGYAPPEQPLPLARPMDEDHQSVDVYALAATVVEALTGLPPRVVPAPGSLLNDRGRALLDAWVAAARSGDDEGFRALAHQPSATFLDLARATTWGPADDDALSDAIARGSRRPHPPAVGTAVDALAATLRRALDPDPRPRLKRAATLAAALGKLREAVVASSNSDAAAFPGGSDVAAVHAPATWSAAPVAAPTVHAPATWSADARRARSEAPEGDRSAGEAHPTAVPGVESDARTPALPASSAPSAAAVPIATTPTPLPAEPPPVVEPTPSVPPPTVPASAAPSRAAVRRPRVLLRLLAGVTILAAVVAAGIGFVAGRQSVTPAQGGTLVAGAASAVPVAPFEGASRGESVIANARAMPTDTPSSAAATPAAPGASADTPPTRADPAPPPAPTERLAPTTRQGGRSPSRDTTSASPSREPAVTRPVRHALTLGGCAGERARVDGALQPFAATVDLPAGRHTLAWEHATGGAFAAGPLDLVGPTARCAVWSPADGWRASEDLARCAAWCAAD